jgi:hypothetical protein
LTRASITPGTALNADSTVDTQEAQVIPATERWIALIGSVRADGLVAVSSADATVAYRSGSDRKLRRHCSEQKPRSACRATRRAVELTLIPHTGSRSLTSFDFGFIAFIILTVRLPVDWNVKWVKWVS